MKVCLYGCCSKVEGQGSGSRVGRIPESPPCCRQPWCVQAEWREEMRGWGLGEKQLWSGLRAEALHGSQVPRSVLSRERLLVFLGDTGLGGLLRLELLEAVECLGESESSPS